MENIEDLLEIELINNLKYLYGKKETQTTLLLFFLRSHIYYNSNKLETRDYVDFLCNELNLPNKVIFKNIEISKLPSYSNSLFNIIDNFKFEFLESNYYNAKEENLSGEDFIVNKYNEYYKETYRKLKSKKNKTIFKCNMLHCLKIDFNLNLNYLKRFDNFYYPDNHNDFKLSFDEECNIHYNEYIKEHKSSLEVNLEDFIYNEGKFFDIQIMERQMKTKNGIIDLFGKDKNGIPTVIELKVVKKPKDLIWQTLTYRDDIKNMLNVYPRVIVVGPKLDESILNQLSDNVEVYEYKRVGKKFNFMHIKNRIN